MSGQPYTVNFLRVRNNVDFYRTFTLKSKDESDTVAPINLASATLFMKWKPALDLSATPVVALAVGTGITKTDSANGKISVLVDSEVMKAIAPGKYKYDLVMVRGGISETVMEGYLKIVQGATDL